MAWQRNQIERPPVTPWIRITPGPYPACWMVNWSPVTATRGMFGGSRSLSVAEASGEEFGQFAQREVAVGPPAEFGHQLAERQGPTVMDLEHLAEYDSVDRGQPQVGEEV